MDELQNQNQILGEAETPKKTSKLIWVLLGFLVSAGLAIGVYWTLSQTPSEPIETLDAKDEASVLEVQSVHDEPGTYILENNGYLLHTSNPTDEAMELGDLLFSLRNTDGNLELDGGSAFTFVGDLNGTDFTASYSVFFGEYTLEGELVSDNHVEGRITLATDITEHEIGKQLPGPFDFEFELEPFDNPDGMVVDPMISPQAWPFATLLKSVKDQDIELFKSAYSEHKKEDFSSDWEGYFSMYSNILNYTYPDFELSDFDYSVAGPSFYMIETITFKGEKTDWAPLIITLEEGGWKIDEN